ncbi:YusU family protein [Metabacillus arenae]|uniref:YusU family protein n=1 Tax=Metabacillus arenae TaxID=2771434 RepID=A0A926NAT8_9BACI|nr:YusU family protein [Metabacillus arenae]MBD1380782.1 YusU family protein [Metabacillus arenae]
MEYTKLNEQMDGLIEKYTELLLGESNPDLKEKVMHWVLYSHIAKSMPPLAKHWNESYPDAKEAMKQLISEIKEMNVKHRNSTKNKDKEA